MSTRWTGARGALRGRREAATRPLADVRPRHQLGPKSPSQSRAVCDSGVIPGRVPRVLCEHRARAQNLVNLQVEMSFFGRVAVSAFTRDLSHPERGSRIFLLLSCFNRRAGAASLSSYQFAQLYYRTQSREAWCSACEHGHDSHAYVPSAWISSCNRDLAQPPNLSVPLHPHPTPAYGRRSTCRSPWRRASPILAALHAGRLALPPRPPLDITPYPPS